MGGSGNTKLGFITLAGAGGAVAELPEEGGVTLPWESSSA